jgi:hypothetical protein
MTDLTDHDEKTGRVPPNCVNVLEPRFFDYLGILETATTENTKAHSQLLVMQNLLNHYSKFQILLGRRVITNSKCFLL